MRQVNILKLKESYPHTYSLKVLTTSFCAIYCVISLERFFPKLPQLEIPCLNLTFLAIDGASLTLARAVRKAVFNVFLKQWCYEIAKKCTNAYQVWHRRGSNLISLTGNINDLFSTVEF